MLVLSCTGNESFWKFFFYAGFGFRHRPPAAFLLNSLGHFITRDLLPFSEILNLPDDSELPVAVPIGIDGSVTNQMTFAVLEGSAAQPMKYPDYYAMTFYSFLAVAPAPC